MVVYVIFLQIPVSAVQASIASNGVGTLPLPSVSSSSHMEVSLQGQQSNQSEKETKLDRGTCVTERVSDNQVKNFT